jgi:hypothetical protein
MEFAPNHRARTVDDSCLAAFQPRREFVHTGGVWVDALLNANQRRHFEVLLAMIERDLADPASKPKGRPESRS